jgi:hypothetical protein
MEDKGMLSINDFWRDNVFGIDEIGGHTGVNVTSQRVM